MRFAVYLEPYRLDVNHVGEDIYKPVLVSRHRSPLAAPQAVPIALRYLAWEIADSGRVVRKLSVRDLRQLERGQW